MSRKAPASAVETPASAAGVELFSHTVRRDGRTMATFRGLASGSAAVVEAAVYPIGDELGTEPLRRPFPFPTQLHASRFVDEALVAFEYLGCTVVSGLESQAA